MFYTIIQLHYKNANLYIVAVIIVRSIISKDRNRKTYLSGGNKSMLRLFERWRTELYLFHLIPIPIAKFLSSWYRAKYSSSFFLPFCLSFFFFFSVIFEPLVRRCSCEMKACSSRRTAATLDSSARVKDIGGEMPRPGRHHECSTRGQRRNE